MPKPLLFDHDSLYNDLSDVLIGAGWEILKTSDAGLERESDQRILEFATDARRTVYTANTHDYARLHAEWLRDGRTHAGIIVRTVQQLPIGQQLRALYAIDHAFSVEELVDRLVYLENYL